jgi:CBS domain-containing membrane protein
LIFHAYDAPLSQPRNVIGGFLVSSTIGVATRLLCQYFNVPIFLVSAMAVSLSMLGMNVFGVMHPPGAACAYGAVNGSSTLKNLGFGYILTTMIAATIMLSVALLGNNLSPRRRYPLYW